MDRKEAQRVLSALRDGPEAGESPFTEALALAERDPVLKAWWLAQQEFDRKVTAKLAEVPVPESLRETILTRRNVTPFPAPARYSSWLAAAALIAILCVAGNFWRMANYGPLDRADYASQVLSKLDGPNGPDLAVASPDHAVVKAWLKSHNSPVGSMPAKFASLPSLGCQRYRIHGHTVSLICFSLTDGRVAHLFMVEKGALNDPPDMNGPQFGKKDGWNMACWSDNQMTYMLATQASPDTLKQLL